MTSSSHEQEQSSTIVVGDWATLSEELLNGLVHALNNRVAALSAFVELARFGDDEADSTVVLPDEIAQLHRLNGLFALLPARGPDPEALELPLVLDDAIRLHEHHPRLRSEQCIVISEGAPLPVRVPRWMLVRVLVMLVHAAKLSVDPAQGGGCAIRVVGDPVSVSVHVTTRGEPSPLLSALAKRCMGTITHEGDELVFRLPSILELRRLERAGLGNAS